MAESSEGISPNLESTVKPSTPIEKELLHGEPSEKSDEPATETPVYNPEQSHVEIQKIGANLREQQASKETAKAQPHLVSTRVSTTTYVSERKPSFAKRVSNIFVDTRLLALAGTAAKSWGAVIGADIIASVIGHPQWSVYAAIPILVYTGYEAGRAVFGGGIQLGQFTNLFKEYAVKSKVTPVGTVRSGEMVGSVHLMNSIGKMSDLSSRERALAVPLDGLKGLAKLGEKFEQNSKEVKDIVVIRAASHLVAQNRELFEDLGFTLQDQSDSEKNSTSNKIAGKILIPPIWGIRQLFRERSLRGFREANQIRLGETQTAWITPQQLYSPQTKSAIERNIQRVEPVLLRVQTRTAA